LTRHDYNRNIFRKFMELFMEDESLITSSPRLSILCHEIYTISSIWKIDTYQCNWQDNSAEIQATYKCWSNENDPKVPSSAKTSKGSPEWQRSPPWHRRLHKTEWLTNIRLSRRTLLASQYMTHTTLNLHVRRKESDAILSRMKMLY